MSTQKNINISINSKVFAAAALGAGILVGASTVYVLTRIHEHSNLTKLVSNLHSTIKEVKEDLANIENELSVLHGPGPLPDGPGPLPDGPGPLPDEKSHRRKNKKVVSFSSTTSSSYKTAENGNDDASFITDNESLSDTASWKTAPTYDTDYFSPDEENDEFFDISPPDEDGDVYISNEINSDDISNLSILLKTVDSLIDGSPECQEEAYNYLEESGVKYENNAEILWRKAKAARNLALIEEKNGNSSMRKDLLEKGLVHATRGLQINDKSADTHKWYAILCCSRGEFISTSERIESGQVFKKHIDIALQISPNDATLHHLLGRFCFEVSLLSWWERKVASALFGEVPQSSYNEALDHFLAAEELKGEGGWKENRLFIAKCYLKKQSLTDAEIWLRKALDIAAVTVDDELVNKEIDELKNQFFLEL